VWHDVFVIYELACVQDAVHAWWGVAQPTCEAWRKASERHGGVHIMRDRSLARGVSQVGMVRQPSVTRYGG